MSLILFSKNSILLSRYITQPIFKFTPRSSGYIQESVYLGHPILYNPATSLQVQHTTAFLICGSVTFMARPSVTGVCSWKWVWCLTRVAILYSRLAHAVTGVSCPIICQQPAARCPAKYPHLDQTRVDHACSTHMKTKIKEIQCAWSEKCSLQKRRYTNSLKTYENIIWPDINQSSMWQVQIVHTYMYNLYIWRTKQAPQFGRFTCCSNASKSPF